MPSIRACLDYKHAYVRRNAVLAIYTIYKLVISLSSMYIKNFTSEIHAHL